MAFKIEVKSNHINSIIWKSAILITGIALILSACQSAAPPPPTQTPPPPTQTVPPSTSTPVPATSTVSPVPPTATPEAPIPTLSVATNEPTAVLQIPVPLLPTPPAGAASMTAKAYVNARSGPGTNYVVYGTIPTGATAEVIGVNAAGSWWVIKVPLAPLGQAWVSGQYVTVRNAGQQPVIPAPPVPPTVSIVPPGPNEPQATTLTQTYVRSGPANEFPAYGIAPSGVTARAIGKSQDGQWWIVRINPAKVGMGSGWVAAPFVVAKNVDTVPVVQSPPPPTSVAPPTPPANAPTGTALEYLNLRSGPGTNYPVLGVAAPGATAEITGRNQEGTWWQVKVGNTISPTGLAWVDATYTFAQNTTTVPVVQAPPAPPVVVQPTPAPAAQCVLVSQSPTDGSILAPDTNFQMKWVLKNTSSTTWSASDVDVSFLNAINGIQFHQGSDRYDLTTSVSPGSTYEFNLTGIAPSNPGSYGEAWGIVQGSNVLCPFWLLIQVK